MIDVHCHLNFHKFEDDYDEVIKKAFEKGVELIINTGTKLDSSLKAVDLAQKYENLYAIVGIHPHHADKLEVNWIGELERIARSDKVLGIGETGLDYYEYQSNGIVEVAFQKKVFEAQIELANKLGLPLQIHNRHAGKDIIEILKHHKNLLRSENPGMFHCFAGDMEFLKNALDLGFYIGFDGNITYKGLAPGETVSLPDLVKETPIERIVTETDSPYLTPEPHRGRRNEPSHVILVARAIAQIKGLTFEEVEEKTSKNARELFGLPN